MTTDEERWQSASLPPTRQFKGFQEVLDRTHFHWDLKSGQDGHFIAAVRRRAVDNYVMTNIIADPATGIRSAEDINKCDENYFCLLYYSSGECQLDQGLNSTIISDGRISIWDSTRPARFQNNSRSQQYSLLIPREEAKLMVPGIEDMCGLSIDGTTGLGAILRSHLRQLHCSIDTVDPADRPAVLRATVELVSAAFKPQEANQASSAYRRAVLTRVQEYIVANLADPDLSPASVANSFQFSTRYLHRLFELTDESAGSWIRKRRLNAAKFDLADPAKSSLTITDIAMRRGFADQAHFSHAFKKEFAVSPREFRQSRHH